MNRLVMILTIILTVAPFGVSRGAVKPSVPALRGPGIRVEVQVDHPEKDKLWGINEGVIKARIELRLRGYNFWVGDSCLTGLNLRIDYLPFSPRNGDIIGYIFMVGLDLNEWEFVTILQDIKYISSYRDSFYGFIPSDCAVDQIEKYCYDMVDVFMNEMLKE